MPTSWGLGHAIGGPAQDTPTAFGVGGVGGSFAGADSTTVIALALTKNRLTADFTAATQISGLTEESRETSAGVRNLISRRVTRGSWMPMAGERARYPDWTADFREAASTW
jgi:hypothetical protein